MAAPAVMNRFALSFRDSKGNTSRMLVRIGDATDAATITDLNTLVTDTAALTNASCQKGILPYGNITYGTTAQFASVEDKAIMTFRDPNDGTLHRFAIPAPKLAIFLTDQETVGPAITVVATWITAMQTFAYSSDNALNPLVFVGGVRTRKKLHRKATIWVKDPTLSEPEE